MPKVDVPTKVPPLLRRRNVQQLLLITLFAEIGYGILNVSTMPVFLREDRHFGEGVIGLVLTAFLLSEALFKGTMGHMADVYGRRRMMVLGPAIVVFTPLLTVAIPHHWGYGATFSLVLLRVLDGIAAAMLWPAAYALMGDICDEGEKQEGLSLLNTCFMLGIALALPIGGFVNDTLGEKFVNAGGKHTPSFYLATLMFLFVTLSAYFFVPSAKEQRKQETAQIVEGADIQTFLASMRRIPHFMLLGFITFMGIGFPMVPMKLFAQDQFGMSESGFGLLVLPGALAMALSSVPMGKLGERMGKTKAVHFGMALCVGGLAIIASGAILPFMRTAWAIALGGVPLGAGFLLTIPAWYASVSDVDPNRKASSIGAVMTAQGLGAIVGALLGGVSYEQVQVIGRELSSYSNVFGPELGRYSPFVGSFLCVSIGLLLGLRILKVAPNRSD